MKYYFTVLGFLIAIAGCNFEPIVDIGLQEWTVYLGSDTTIPFFPDAKSNYISYSFERELSDSFLIKLSGTFPNARYMSIVVYDNTTRDPIAIVRDINMIPYSGHRNL